MDSPWGQLTSIQGDVSFEGHFKGRGEQILDHASIAARNVMIDMENESLGLELDMEIQREQDWIQVNFPSRGNIQFGAGNNLISGMLSELLPVLQQQVNSAENTFARH